MFLKEIVAFLRLKDSKIRKKTVMNFISFSKLKFIFQYITLSIEQRIAKRIGINNNSNVTQSVNNVFGSYIAQDKRENTILVISLMNM